MRKKCEIQRFARWCFDYYGLRPIPIRYVNAPAVVSPSGGIGFGCYVWYEERKQGDGIIYIAYKCGKSSLFQLVAHEITHYYHNFRIGMSNLTVRESEEWADQYASILEGKWMRRGQEIRRKRRRAANL